VLAAFCTFNVALAGRIIEVTRSFVDIVGTAIEENRHLDRSWRDSAIQLDEVDFLVNDSQVDLN